LGKSADFIVTGGLNINIVSLFLIFSLPLDLITLIFLNFACVMFRNSSRRWERRRGGHRIPGRLFSTKRTYVISDEMILKSSIRYPIGKLNAQVVSFSWSYRFEPFTFFFLDTIILKSTIQNISKKGKFIIYSVINTIESIIFTDYNTLSYVVLYEISDAMILIKFRENVRITGL
jgi:hypothetical protein